MRTNKLAALSLIALAASASSAFAQQATVLPHGEMDMTASAPFVSQTSRAAVIAELQQSKGVIVSGEAGGRSATPVVSTLTRAEVRAETLKASARGDIRHGEALLAVVGQPVGSTTSVNTVTKPYLSGGLAAIQNGEADGYGATPVRSTRTRAEVKAELQQAVAHGELLTGEVYRSAAAPATSGRTRAEVIAEVKQAMAKGELPLGDLYGPRQL